MENSGCGHHLPEWTDRREIAQEWSNAGFSVVERHLLRGMAGAGIVVRETKRYVPKGIALIPVIKEAPLYTKYQKSQAEYRIHLRTDDDGEGYAFDAQRKVAAKGREIKDWKVRTHANGFIYQREGVEVPECVMQAAKECFNVSGLDFGAMDILHNRHRNKGYVLECNTAPGLEGATVASYARALRGK